MENTQLAPLGIGSVRNGVAYYCDSIAGFLVTDSDVVLHCLFDAVTKEDRTPEQDAAWKDEIFCLQARLKEIKASGFIVFEYNIVRMAKRIDVVLLLRNVVYSLEFKDGQSTYYAEDMDQALDYALRLKAFHKMSKDLYVCPVLIATKAGKSFTNPFTLDSDKTVGLQKTNRKNLEKSSNISTKNTDRMALLISTNGSGLITIRALPLSRPQSMLSTRFRSLLLPILKRAKQGLIPA
jgi:hypothetical protein